jgi:hypothetical protein
MTLSITFINEALGMTYADIFMLSIDYAYCRNKLHYAECLLVLAVVVLTITHAERHYTECCL